MFESDASPSPAAPASGSRPETTSPAASAGVASSKTSTHEGLYPASAASGADADLWQHLVHDAPLISSFVLTLSLLVSIVTTIVQLVITRRLQMRTAATTLWDHYLDRAIERPMFAFPENPAFARKLDVEHQKFDGQECEFERYEWFVSALLRTSDETLRAFDPSDHRAIIIARNIFYHRRYVRWRWPLWQKTYFANLGDKVQTIVRNIATSTEESVDDYETLLVRGQRRPLWRPAVVDPILMALAVVLLLLPAAAVLGVATVRNAWQALAVLLLTLAGGVALGARLRGASREVAGTGGGDAARDGRRIERQSRRD
jgi:hypothetical protein